MEPHGGRVKGRTLPQVLKEEKSREFKRRQIPALPSRALPDSLRLQRPFIAASHNAAEMEYGQKMSNMRISYTTPLLCPALVMQCNIIFTPGPLLLLLVHHVVNSPQMSVDTGNECDSRSVSKKNIIQYSFFYDGQQALV